MGIQARTGKKKHVMLKYMFVQHVLEKKFTNLAYINTKQNKADLMTKCHTSEAHKKVVRWWGWGSLETERRGDGATRKCNE